MRGLTAPNHVQSPGMSADDDGAPAPGDITALLAAVRGGDAAAQGELFQRVYDDLRRIARRQLGSGPSPTLSTTALVHELYLRLSRPGALSQHDRVHFFAVAARAMRQIVIGAARRRGRLKRGGGQRPLDIDVEEIRFEDKAAELVALDRALSRLEAVSPRLAQVVEWRFFGGRTLVEIGEALGLTDRSMKRDWAKARAFLYRELQREGHAP